MSDNLLETIKARPKVKRITERTCVYTSKEEAKEANKLKMRERYRQNKEVLNEQQKRRYHEMKEKSKLYEKLESERTAQQVIVPELVQIDVQQPLENCPTSRIVDFQSPVQNFSQQVSQTQESRELTIYDLPIIYINTVNMESLGD